MKINLNLQDELDNNSALSHKLSIKRAQDVWLQYPFIFFDLSWLKNVEVKKPDVFLKITNSVVLKYKDNEKVAKKFFTELVDNQLSEGEWHLDADQIKNSDGTKTIKVPFEIYDLNQTEDKFPYDVLAIQPRYFNRLVFDSGFVCKSSQWLQKIRAEIFFLNSVPAELEKYFLKPKEFGQTGLEFYYKIKKMKMFDMGRVFVQDSFSNSEWTSFFSDLKNYFSMGPTTQVSAKDFKNQLTELFIKKLIDRVEEFRKIPSFDNHQQAFKESTGEDFKDRLSRLIESLAEQIDLLNDTDLIFSHGDLCFSNILYDRNTKDLKLIDPKGALDRNELFRPIYYDLAKLSQSVNGQYECFLFDRSFDAKRGDSAKNEFKAFLQKMNVNLRFIRLCEASLFWSLLPLHLDTPDRISHFMLAGDRAFMAGLKDGN